MPEQKAVEYLMIYDPTFWKDAEVFCDHFGGNAVGEPVSDLKGLFEVPKKYAMVRHFELDFHGSPGMLYMHDKSASTASYFGSLVQASNMLCRDARVLFYGCNVAGGDDGDNCLDSIGKKMVSGTGGTLGASTVMNLGYGEVIMNPLAFIDGRLKVRRYNESGDRIGGENVDMFGKVWWSSVR